MKRIIVLFVITVAFVLNAGICKAAPRKVRIASHVSKASPLYATAKLFVKKISKKYPNVFDFKFYPNGQLGKEQALINNVKLGSIEMIIVASGVLKLDDKLGIFDLPWLFKNLKQVKKVMTGPFGEVVKKRIEEKQGMIVLGIYVNGFRDVINNKRPIRQPSDMKGLKIRVTGSPYKRKAFSMLGANPLPIAWQETFTAIQEGVADGAEAALYGFYGAKLYQITKYLSLTHHTYTPSFLLVSKNFWNSLNKEQQRGFQEVANEITDQAYTLAGQEAKNYLKDMRRYVKVNQVDIAPFRAKVQPDYQDYENKFGTTWLDMIRKSEQ